jgi:hypothetical protein
MCLSTNLSPTTVCARYAFAGIVEVVHERTVGLIGFLLRHASISLDLEAHESKVPGHDNLEPVIGMHYRKTGRHMAQNTAETSALFCAM